VKDQTKAEQQPETPTRPVYRPAVVTFLDILGFSSLVKNGTAEEVAKVLSTLRRFAESKQFKEPDDTDAISLNFSDCIIRIRFLDGINQQQPIGHLFHEILDLVHIQGELVPHRILIRGGMTMGDICATGSTVFGPAMVTAYELESRSAIYPRIVIDPVLLNSVRVDHRLRAADNSVDYELQAIRNLIRRGESGAWFVDYLRASFAELDEPEDWHVLLANHQELIQKRYQGPGRTAYLDKILWLATYHNDVVSEIPTKSFDHNGLLRDDFIVKTKDIPELARMPKRKRE